MVATLEHEKVSEDMEITNSEDYSPSAAHDHHALHDYDVRHMEQEDLVDGTLKIVLHQPRIPITHETEVSHMPPNITSTPAIANESPVSVGSFNNFGSVYSRILPFTSREAVLMRNFIDNMALWVGKVIPITVRSGF